MFKKLREAPTMEQLIKDLEQRIMDYNSEVKQTCAAVATLNSDPVVVICTPLMKRVHEIVKASSELMFIDTTRGLERHQWKVYLLLTHSCAGGLPLGCIISMSESHDIISYGLKLLQTILPEHSFFGRGAMGPSICMIDDSTSMRQAMHSVFPNSFLVLSIFHILQAMWRFLWDEKNNISVENRHHLLSLVKDMTYAESVDILERNFCIARLDSIASKYPTFLRHVESIFDQRDAWSICLRANLPVHGYNTTDFVESAMRVLKEKVFYRVRSFNVVQVFDFIVTRYEDYCERKLHDIIDDRFDVALSKRFMPQSSDIGMNQITQVSDLCFVVNSETKAKTEYAVDMLLGMCACFDGRNGAPCKHQYAVFTHFHVDCFNFLRTPCTALRDELQMLVTSSNNVPQGNIALPKSPNNVNISSLDTDVAEDMESSPESRNLLEESGEQEVNDRPLASAQDIHSGMICTDTFDLTHITSEVMRVARNLCLRLNANPSLVPAVQCFINESDRLCDDVALSSALAWYGKYGSED